MIEVQGLVKDFGTTRAVAGVSFSVRAGEIMGLLGPNGSGKTTIMRVLTGFFPPSEGRVARGLILRTGRNPGAQSPAAAEIGTVPPPAPQAAPSRASTTRRW